MTDLSTATIATDAELAALLGPGWVGDSSPQAWAGDPSHIAVYTVHPSDPAAVDALLGAVWRGPLRGEYDDGAWHELIPGHLYVVDLDTTKSQRDDVPDAWDAHKHWLVEGTPVRTTDRRGPGTKGTRAHAGLGPVLIAWK